MTGLPSDLDLGALLAEQDFVRRLVRSLVHHDTDADDVAQQTWVAALQRPLHQRTRARAFLAQVARHVASNFRRGEGRRRQRESDAAAEATATPSVVDAFARESLRQQVVTELAALPEPYRGTLVLRFFEDLAPHAIARRDGTPAATVRARLMRGLDMLRERLDHRYGGDRSAWCVALLPLARGGSPVGTAGALATAGIFGLRQMLFVGAAGVVLAAALWWLHDDSAPAAFLAGTAPEHAARVTTAATSTAAATPPAARAPLSPHDATHDAATDAAPDNAIRGRLVLPDGEPATRRKVEVIGLDPTRLFDGDAADLSASVPLVAATTESGDDGRFVIADVRPRALLVLQAGRGEAHSACQPIPHTPGPAHVVDLGDIVLAARGEVCGRVEDEDGNPVASAEVWAADVPGLVTLAVNVDRFVPAHGAILLLPQQSPGEEVGAFLARTKHYLGSDVFMRPQAPGKGFDACVLDTPAWFTQLFDALPIARATSRADGGFTLRDVEPATDMVVVRKAGFDCAVKPNVKVAAGAPRDLGAITLRRGETCGGSVLDATGRPVPDAAVRVAMLPAAGFRGLAFCDADVRTDARGRFAISGLRSGRVLVAARVHDDEPWLVRGPFAVDATIALQFAAPAELTVRVTSATNQGPPQVRLAFGPSLGELARMGLRRAVDLADRVRTDASGLHVRDLVPGSYQLEVTAPGCVAARRLVQVPGTVDVALAPQVPAFDVVVVSSANVPIAGARVRCAPPDPELLRTVMPTSYGLPAADLLATSLGCTDIHGRLRVSGLPFGTVTLWADHAAYGLGVARVELPAEGVVLRLPVAATIEGVLLDGGQPARASAWRITATPTERADGVTRAYALAAPAADGSFCIKGLEPGAHTVRVLPALPPRLSLQALQEMVADRIFSFFLDYDAARTREVVLREGEVRALQLDVKVEPRKVAEQTRVDGRVTINGVAATGVRVQSMLGFFVGKSPLATTGADGTYTVEGLSEGTHELTFLDAHGTVLGKRTVTVPERGNVTFDFDVRTARLAGRVVAPSNRTLEGAQVSGIGPGGATFAAAVGGDGRFAAEHLACGSWSLAVSGSGITGPETATNVTLLPDQPADDVVLHAVAGCALDVQVEGVTGARAYVELIHVATKSTWYDDGTDKDGVVRFHGLRQGRYRLAVKEPALTGEIELDDKERRSVRLTVRGVVPIE